MFWREGSVAIQRQLGTSLQVQAKESHKVGRRCRKLRNCRSWATCKSSVSWIDEDFDDAPPDASKIRWYLARKSCAAPNETGLKQRASPPTWILEVVA